MSVVAGLAPLSKYPGVASEAGLLELNGIRLYVERHVGDGVDPAATPVLGLHGVGGSADSMGLEVQGLAGDRPVVVYDARGHGRSTRPQRFGIDDHVADALAVLDALGVDRFAVLGVSMGSYVAPNVAAAAPDRAVALVLVVPKAYGDESSTARYMRENPERFAGRSPEELAEVMFDVIVSPTHSPDERAALAAAMAAVNRPELMLSPLEFQRANEALAGFDNRPVLATPVCPVLVISGEDDVLNPPADGEVVAAAAPGSRFVVVQGAGHALALERTAEYLALVRPFLASPLG